MRLLGIASAVCLAALAGAVTPGRAAAQSVVPQVKSQAAGGYVFSTGNTYWRFLMGPAKSPSKSMLFYHDPAPEEGGLSLACKRGSPGGAADVVAIAPIAPLGVPPGAQVDIALTVQGETRDLKMRVMKNSVGLVGVGPAPVAIISKMGDMPQGIGGAISATYKGTMILAVVIPQDHTIASNVAEICRDWAVPSSSN